MFETMVHANPSMIETISDVEILTQDNASYRILYNQFNIDSCYAATLVAEHVLFWNKTARITTIAIDYFNYQQPTNKSQVLILCGVNLTVRDLLTEFELSSPALALRFQYNNRIGDGVVKNVGEGKFVNITPKSDSVSDDELEHISSDNSISVLVNDYFSKTLGVVEISESRTRLLGVVAGYVNMRPFPSIFEKKPENDRTKGRYINTGRIGYRDRDDLSFLYRNKDTIEESARQGTTHKVIESESETVRDYSANLNTAKNIIRRNMSEQIYSGKSKYFKAQTVCVTEENAFEVMRLLNLALETVVTYEDMQNYRVWRIICPGSITLELAREAIKPIMEWLDCKIHYFVTHLVPPMALQR